MLQGHRFYEKTGPEKLQFFLKLGGFSLFFILGISLLSFWSGLYFMGIYLFVIYLTIIAPFIDIPGLQKRGGLVYYSLLFVGEKEKKDSITVHGGSLFDYYFVLDKKANGKQRTQFILVQYLIGLVHILDSLEDPINSPKTIKGTSYFLNIKTAKRMGFNQVPTHGIQKLILLFNYFNILCSQSLVKGNLTFPNLSKIRSFETTSDVLMANKPNIQRLIAKLSG